MQLWLAASLVVVRSQAHAAAPAGARTSASNPDVASRTPAGQAVVAGYVLRTAVGWFLRLDREAARREADLVLQDPTSLKMVRI